MHSTSAVSSIAVIPLRALLFLGCLWMLQAGPISSQTAAIEGSVTDGASGLSLPGANIEVTSPDLKTGAVASSSGEFQVRGLRAATYVVTVTYVGYTEMVYENIVLAEGSTHHLEVVLIPSMLRLNPIEVTASRRRERVIESPAAVSIVARNQVDTRPVLSLAEHLVGLPGVDVVSTGILSDRPVVRGFNGDYSWRLLTLTDYRISNLAAYRGSQMQFNPTSADDIDQIEVVSGPASAIYGPNAAGGVVHLITRSPFASKGTTVSLGLGERDVFTGSFRHAGANDRVGYKISVDYHRGKDWESTDPAEPDSILKGYQTPDGRVNRGERVANIRDFDVEKLSADVRVDYRADNGATTILSGGISKASNIAVAAPSAAQFHGVRFGYAQLRFVYGDLFAQAYYNRNALGEDSFFLRSGDLFFDHSTQFVSQVQHSLTALGGAQRFVYGVDALFTRPKTEGTFHGRNEDNDSFNEVGLYLQSESALSHKVKLVGALRFDDQNHLPDPVWSPRAALVVKPRDNHSLRLSYNRAFDSPRPLDLFGDLLVAPSLGPLPYAIRVRMTSPQKPLTFRRDADGGLDGLYMQSPFNPNGRSEELPLDATRMWGAAVALLQGQGVDLSDVPQPGGDQVATALKTLNLTTGAFDPTSPASVQDLPLLKPAKTTTVEVGYKGVIDEKLLLNVSLYRENNVNFYGGTNVESPSVFFHTSSLTEFLRDHRSLEEAAQLAETLGGIPVATVTAQEADPADLLVAQRNTGNVTYYGAEFSLDYQASPEWTFGGAYTHRNKNAFEKSADPLDRDRFLNASKHQVSARALYEDTSAGLRGELRFRYVEGYPVRSIFAESVDTYSVFDLSARYRLPFFPGADLLLSVQNVLNNGHKEHAGGPEIGRLTILKMRYSL